MCLTAEKDYRKIKYGNVSMDSLTAIPKHLYCVSIVFFNYSPFIQNYDLVNVMRYRRTLNSSNDFKFHPNFLK